jgi:nicotinamide-nucleotide amidase
MRIEEKVAKSLTSAQKSLSIAESCTGGLLSNRLTNMPGSSNFLKLSVVAYSNEAKIKILNVSRKQIAKYGAVSSQVAISMAQGIRKIQKTDFGIGITGIAGPTGATKTKPVGLTFIAISSEVETLCVKCRFPGARISIKNQAATLALQLLDEFLA